MADRQTTSTEGGTRYRHTNASGGSDDQGERKDEGWTRFRGGPQHRDPGRRSGEDQRPPRPNRGGPVGGTNTQGHLAGIGDASRDSAERLEREQSGSRNAAEEQAENDVPGPFATDKPKIDPADGTDQPPRMGGPLGADPRHPHLPAGEQTNEEKGTGARGFDRGVDASVVGTQIQGARPEDPSRATLSDD